MTDLFYRRSQILFCFVIDFFLVFCQPPRSSSLRLVWPKFICSFMCSTAKRVCLRDYSHFHVWLSPFRRCLYTIFVQFLSIRSAVCSFFYRLASLRQPHWPSRPLLLLFPFPFFYSTVDFSPGDFLPASRSFFPGNIGGTLHPYWCPWHCDRKVAPDGVCILEVLPLYHPVSPLSGDCFPPPGAGCRSICYGPFFAFLDRAAMLELFFLSLDSFSLDQLELWVNFFSLLCALSYSPSLGLLSCDGGQSFFEGSDTRPPCVLAPSFFQPGAFVCTFFPPAWPLRTRVFL